MYNDKMDIGVEGPSKSVLFNLRVSPLEEGEIGVVGPGTERAFAEAIFLDEKFDILEKDIHDSPYTMYRSSALVLVIQIIHQERIVEDQGRRHKIEVDIYQHKLRRKFKICYQYRDQ